MKSAVSQKGLSLVGWLIALFIIGFIVSAAFKVVPHYLDDMAMKKIITAISTDKADEVSSVDDFYTHVARGMQVNNIRDLDLKTALSVTEQRDQYLAHLQYEKREPLVGNIDLVVKFDHEFSVRKP
ncbi:DUF4845 domain-containing protein [Pseudomonas sp. HR96]|uniref:DUF4845 domain-containing protein n=1 Tax=Pseudomonas sp. HR96 TaxID=1027966 RepID=UPI002A76521B|nr:DUF4845 domain-containing protein [Pseudomonas sp. HR96]WPP00887.1 DUF4845 domain-containing protein [Pseudomonas sp. HR96]